MSCVEILVLLLLILAKTWTVFSSSALINLKIITVLCWETTVESTSTYLYWCKTLVSRPEICLKHAAYSAATGFWISELCSSSKFPQIFLKTPKTDIGLSAAEFCLIWEVNLVFIYTSQVPVQCFLAPSMITIIDVHKSRPHNSDLMATRFALQPLTGFQ